MILDPTKLIIMRSDLATTQQRLTTLGLLLFFWGIVLYLLHKLSAALGWGMAVLLYNRATGQSSGLSGLLDMGATYLPLIAIFCCAFVCWAAYNKIRFSGSRDKRRFGQFFLKNTEIARLFQLEEETLDNLQQAKFIAIDYDKYGSIKRFRYS